MPKQFHFEVMDPRYIAYARAAGGLVWAGDSKTGEEIMILLRQLNEEEGKTFILITHDPMVAQNTDRLISFKDGIIEGEKTFKDMI